MFSQKICVAVLTLALSSFTAQAAPAPNFGQFGGNNNGFGQFCNNNNNGGQVSTVTHTVTVTAPPSSQTSGSVEIVNSGGNNGGSNNNSGSSNNNGSSSNGGSKGSNNGSKGNSGGSQNNNNGGGKNNGSGNSNNSNNNSGGNNNGSSQSNNNGGQNSNNNGGGNNNSTGSDSSDAQSSLTLDPRVIAQGFANNGQDVPTAGQVASLTSTNNFINFCLTVNVPITNGQQIKTGSCNPAPMGTIPSTDNMPSSKFSFPTNFGAVKTNTAFTIEMEISGMETGFFVNADENYFAAPQQLNAQGQIQGHSHVVIQQIDSVDSTAVLNPNTFAFFKGLNSAASNGKLTADVTAGLPQGVYKLASINTAANHQPVLVPIAQHGSLDDAIYFFVTDDGQPPADSPLSSSNNAGAGASSSAAASSTATASASDSTLTAASASVTASVSTAVEASASASATSAATATGNGGKGGKGSQDGVSASASAVPSATKASGAKSSAVAPSASVTGTAGANGDNGKNGSDGASNSSDSQKGNTNTKNAGNTGDATNSGANGTTSTGTNGKNTNTKNADGDSGNANDSQGGKN